MRAPDSPYADMLDSAYRAFASDVSYAVAMAKQATSLQRKRDVWALRMELRGAERQARALCARKRPFACEVASPCGTGECPFAVGDLRRLSVPLEPTAAGKPHGGTAYNIEAAVGPLREIRDETA